MERLLKSKGIYIQQIVDLYQEQISIAYTDKLLQLGVLIEFSGVSLSKDNLIHEEVTVAASYHLDGVILYCALFVAIDAVLGPLPILRIIADAVEFIENSSPKDIVEDLKSISTSYSIIDRDDENPDFYENEIFKHTQCALFKTKDQI